MSGVLPRILFWSIEDPADHAGTASMFPKMAVKAVVEHLKNGELLEPTDDPHICRICGINLGHDILSDGEVAWPRNAQHYVVAHRVWSPQHAWLSERLLLMSDAPLPNPDPMEDVVDEDSFGEDLDEFPVDPSVDDAVEADDPWAGFDEKIEQMVRATMEPSEPAPSRRPTPSRRPSSSRAFIDPAPRRRPVRRAAPDQPPAPRHRNRAPRRQAPPARHEPVPSSNMSRPPPEEEPSPSRLPVVPGSVRSSYAPGAPPTPPHPTPESGGAPQGRGLWEDFMSWFRASPGTAPSPSPMAPSSSPPGTWKVQDGITAQLLTRQGEAFPPGTVPAGEYMMQIWTNNAWSDLSPVQINGHEAYVLYVQDDRLKWMRQS
jgi:hypothetical protein